MNKLLALTTLLLVLPAACDVQEVQPTDDVPVLTKAEAQALGGKADAIDYCEWLGWYGDGICDAWCAEPDPDCDAGDGGGDTCEDLGGECLSSPIDITFAADCAADYGMASGDASCGAVINLSCCVPVEDDGGDDGEAPVSCEDIGGECLSSPVDITFAANCESDYGLVDGDGSCGGVINLSCCVPDDDDGDDGDDSDGGACADAGGSCMSSPIDVTFAADCEGELGLDTFDADCPFFNQSCCG